MKTTFLIEQHNRAIRLLEAIEKNEYYMNAHKKDLIKPLPIWANRRTVEDKMKRIEVCEAIALRLEKSYQNIISKINSKYENLKQVA